MKLYELQKGALNQDLDDQLQNIGQNMNNQLGQENNTPEQPQQPNPQPDLDGQDQMGPGQDKPEPKKVDPYLVAQLKSLPYVTNYEWDESDNASPYQMMQMSIPELENARNLIRTKMNMKTMSDQVGLYDDPGMKFYIDGISFVEKLLSLMKSQSGGKRGQIGPTAQK